MTLTELRQTAFAKWLKEQDREAALEFLFEGLSSRLPESMSWQLFEACGLKTLTPKSLEYMLDMILSNEGDAAHG